MVQSLVMLVVVSALVIGPLAWRVWRDRGEARALAVRADVHAALVGALSGESLVSVRVLPRTPWQDGRVILSAPTGCESLIRSAWSAVVAKVPDGYDLVVRSGHGAVPRAPFTPLAWGEVS